MNALYHGVGSSPLDRSIKFRAYCIFIQKYFMKILCKGTVKSLIVDCASITTMNFYSVKSKVSYIFLFNGAAIYIDTNQDVFLFAILR